MSSPTTPLSGAQARTRAAIIDATVKVLADNRMATLPDIAAAAGVGRTTVHRYFPDRESLLYQATLDSIAVINQLAVDVAADQGPAREAMHRVINAMVSVGDRVVFLFGDPAVMRNIAPADHPDDVPLMDLIKRGQAEGVFCSELSATWIEHTLFALVLKGCQDAAAGELPRHLVAPTIIRTFECGVRA
ncbi:TetR/AcrR family transcriptional regulator [Mycobacterium sp. LTG2003]